MKRVMIPAAGVLAALAVAGPASADPADVTLHCTSTEFKLPPGPPPKVGHITIVTANGDLVVDRFVPGPCSAPGF